MEVYQFFYCGQYWHKSEIKTIFRSGRLFYRPSGVHAENDRVYSMETPPFKKPIIISMRKIIHSHPEKVNIVDRRLLILGAAIVIVALIVGAAPVAGSQTTLLKKILKGVQALQEPVGYEYYTAEMWSNGPTGVYVSAFLVNEGDTPADVSWTLYHHPNSSGWYVYKTISGSIDPGERMTCSPSLSAPSTIGFKYKFTTNSKYVLPWASLANNTNGAYIDRYLPGDFQKVEIYG